ncbi:hypothetical protein BGC_29770 [Burkholderia sp. 3C]
MIGLDLLQLAKQPIVFGIGQIGLVEHVIRVIRALEFVAQPGRPFGRLAGWRFYWGSGHAGGTCSRDNRVRIISGGVRLRTVCLAPAGPAPITG